MKDNWKSILQGRFGSIIHKENPSEREAKLKDAAINAWEQNLSRNKDRLKVIRGKGNIPVEVIMTGPKEKPIPAIMVNGVQKLVPGFKFDDAIAELEREGKPTMLYSVHAVQRLTYASGKDQKAFYVLTGVPRF